MSVTTARAIRLPSTNFSWVIVDKFLDLFKLREWSETGRETKQSETKQSEKQATQRKWKLLTTRSGKQR